MIAADAPRSRWWPRAALATAAMAAALVLLRRPAATPRSPVRVATFNIEDFPKDDRQVDGAFALIASLDADAIAVQEIRDPDRFARAARRVLGPRWRFVSVDTMPDGSRRAPYHVGVLFDEAVFQVARWEVHDDTRLGGRHKPTLEVVLRPRAHGPALHVFVVHLKSGGDGRDTRADQLRALRGVLDRLDRTGARSIVLGDFNATEPADRDDLAALATATGLRWATQDLPCSAFWRRDGDCATSRLDHALTSWAAPAVTAHGACATEGCAPRDRCPAYRDEVSDHCPVTIDLPSP